MEEKEQYKSSTQNELIDAPNQKTSTVDQQPAGHRIDSTSNHLVDEFCSARGFRRISIKPDGDCLFRAICYGLLENQLRSADVKENIMGHFDEYKNRKRRRS